MHILKKGEDITSSRRVPIAEDLNNPFDKDGRVDQSNLKN